MKDTPETELIDIPELDAEGWNEYALEQGWGDGMPLALPTEAAVAKFVAACRGVASGVFENYIADFEAKTYADPALEALKQKLVDNKQHLANAIRFVKQQSPSYLDVAGQRLVDSAMIEIMGHLLLGQAEKSDRKKAVARRFIDREMPVLRMKCEQICSGDTSPMTEYLQLAGPVPSTR